MKDFTKNIIYIQLIFNPTMPRVFYRYLKHVLFFAKVILKYPFFC